VSIKLSNLDTFDKYYQLPDMLIEQASKEQLAECARLLALSLAHHQGKLGEIPLDDTLALIDSTEPNDEQLKLLASGMENLVGVLGNVCSGFGEEKH